MVGRRPARPRAVRRVRRPWAAVPGLRPWLVTAACCNSSTSRVGRGGGGAVARRGCPSLAVYVLSSWFFSCVLRPGNRAGDRFCRDGVLPARAPPQALAVGNNSHRDDGAMVRLVDSMCWAFPLSARSPPSSSYPPRQTADGDTLPRRRGLGSRHARHRRHRRRCRSHAGVAPKGGASLARPRPLLPPPVHLVGGESPLARPSKRPLTRGALRCLTFR